VLGRNRDVNCVDSNAVAHDDAASLHSRNHTLCDWRSYSEHAVSVFAEVRKLLFAGHLGDDESSARCFNGLPFLLDIRKAVIGDNDLHVSPALLETAKL